MNKAIFLDRDGVINQKPKEGEYITSWADFHLLPGVAEGIGLLNRAGYIAVVVTNQRCVAKGLLSAAHLERMHEQMSQALLQANAKLDGIYYCPHDYQAACICRKPAPGMLLEAARRHSIDLESSWMIGDSEIDVQAGMNAGCKTARVFIEGEIHNTGGRHALGQAEITANSLLDSVHQILEWDARPRTVLEKRNVIA
jgi:D-glycero-D-manno-heptose 1,7-bisphosphate phosphatase